MPNQKSILNRKPKSKKKPKLKTQSRSNPEYDLHKAICDFIRLAYPKAMFNSDQSGTNMSKTARGRAKMLRSERGFPDLTIFEPSIGCHGLHLEIKVETPFKKDGTLKAGEHLKEQQHVINKLNERGYYAQFVWSLDMAIEVIRDYFG